MIAQFLLYLSLFLLLFGAVTQARAYGVLGWPQGVGMLHLAAFGQSISSNGVLTQIAGVPDQSLTVAGGDIRVPSFASKLAMTAALNNDATAARAQLSSPSLRAMVNMDIEPVVPNKVFGSPIEPYWRGDQPFDLVVNESLNFFTQNAQAAAVLSYGLIWLADGPVKPVQGNAFSIRATSAVALVAATWVNGPLVFGQVLPYGTYAVVGMRARGTNLLAARLVFPGAFNRPGVPGVNVIGGLDYDFARYGDMGIFGQFDSTVPPTVDCLGDTDAAQTFIFDLVKVK